MVESPYPSELVGALELQRLVDSSAWEVAY